VELTLLNQDGTVLETRDFDFEGHLAKFFSEVFSDVPSQFLGHVLVRSEYPIYLTVVRLETTPIGFELTSTPPDVYVP
jgi:hypothetical protein